MSSNDQRKTSSGRREKSSERTTDEVRVTRSRTLSRARGELENNGRLDPSTGQANSTQSDQLQVGTSGTSDQERQEVVGTAASEISVATASNVTSQERRNSRLGANMEEDSSSPASVAGTTDPNNPNILHHVLQNNRDKLKIEVFDGKPGQDLDRWIKDYKLRTRNAGWNDLAVKDGIPMYLGGKYKHWFEGKVVYVSDEKKKKYDTPEKIFEMMLEAELHDKENWLKKLKDLKQGDAPLNRYLQDLEMICNEINEDMSEQQRVEYAYEGMNKELGIKIFEKRPKDLDEMRKYGKEVEAGYRKFKDEKDIEKDDLKKLKNELLHLKEKKDIETLAEKLKRIDVKPPEEEEEIKTMLKNIAQVVSSTAAMGHQPSHSAMGRQDHGGERQGGGRNGFHWNANRNRGWNDQEKNQNSRERNWNGRSRSYWNRDRRNENRENSRERTRDPSRERYESRKDGNWQRSSSREKYEGRFPQSTVRFASGTNDSTDPNDTRSRDGGPRCYNCKMKGHIARNCPGNNDGRRPRNSSGTRSAASSPKRPWDPNRNGHVARMARISERTDSLVTQVIQTPDGYKNEAVIDTGSTVSMIDAFYCLQHRFTIIDEETKINSVDGRLIHSKGKVTLKIKYDIEKGLQSKALTIEFRTINFGRKRGPIILGSDFLFSANAAIDMADKKITYKGNESNSPVVFRRRANWRFGNRDPDTESDGSDSDDSEGTTVRMAYHDVPDSKLTYVHVVINGKKETAIMDTGADKCIMSSSLAEKLKVEPDLTKCPVVRAIDGEEIGILGTAIVTLTYDLDKYPRDITLEIVVSIDDRDFLILGDNFSNEVNAVIHSRLRIVEFPLKVTEERMFELEEQKKKEAAAKQRVANAIKKKPAPAPQFTTKEQFDHLLKEYEATKEEQQKDGQRKQFTFLVGSPENWTTEDFLKEFKAEEKIIEYEDLAFGAGTIKVGNFMTPEQKERLLALLEKFRNVFSFPGESLGQCDLYLHQIDTGDSPPIHEQPRATADKNRVIIKELVQEMLKDGVAQPSKSPWASPPHLVPKPDGSTRMVIDYRALNKVTKRDSYPMPSIDLALSCLNGSKFFSTLDLLQGFNQVMMSPESIEKTAFTTHDGLFEYKRMPFGLRNSPSTFQRIMDVILSDIKFSQVMVFLDDILIFSETFESHLERMENVFQRLQEARLTVKPSKVFLMLPGVKYLGHFIDETGVKMQYEKVASIIKFPQPKTVTEVKSFLGLAGYYRRFIRNFAALSEPLSRLTRKSLPFDWTDLQQASFNFLKRELLSYPVLCHYNNKLPIELHVDASGTGLGSVIGHRIENAFHPIQFISRLLSDVEKRYSTTDQEALCIVYSVDKFKRYLVGVPFTIFTDHKALTWIKSKSKLPDRLHRFSLELQPYDYTVEYKPGKLNTDADALSRYPASPAENTELNMPLHAMAAIEDPKYQWPQAREKVQKEQKEDKLFGTIFKKLETNQNCQEKKKFFLEDGLLFRRKRRKTGEKVALCVPKSMQEDVMYHLHDDILGGHLGVVKMLDKLRERFYFPKMEPFVRKYIASCQSCSFRKKERLKAAGFLKSIEVGKPFDLVAIDFWESPRKAESGNRYVIVASDYLTRYVEIKAVTNGSAEETADFVVNNLIANFGCPSKILTDRGKNFNSRLMKAIYEMMTINKVWTTAYKPSTDGLVEQFNHTMAEMLSHYVSIGMHDWDKWIQLLKFAYNSSRCSSHGYCPFYLMKGYEPRLPLEVTLEIPTFADPKQKHDDLYLTNLMASLNDARECAKKAIAHSQELSARYHNKKRRDLKFSEGDLVLQYEHRSNKLSHKFSGPYKVTKVYPNNTVKLESISGKHYKSVVNIQDLKMFKERILYDSSSENSTDSSDSEKEITNEKEDSDSSLDFDLDNMNLNETAGERSGPITRSRSKEVVQESVENDELRDSSTEKNEEKEESLLPRRSARRRKQSRKYPETVFALMVTTFLLPPNVNPTFIRMNPIVWKQSEKPVIAGITQVFTSINYEQPCLIFNDSLTDKFKPYTNQYRTWCLEEFKDTWVNQFKKFCSQPSAIGLEDGRRHKRERAAAVHNLRKRFIRAHSWAHCWLESLLQ